MGEYKCKYNYSSVASAEGPVRPPSSQHADVAVQLSNIKLVGSKVKANKSRQPVLTRKHSQIVTRRLGVIVVADVYFTGVQLGCPV